MDSLTEAEALEQALSVFPEARAALLAYLDARQHELGVKSLLAATADDWRDLKGKALLVGELQKRCISAATRAQTRADEDEHHG